jgi:hypothetical protein
MKRARHFHRSSDRSFALISTLLILAILTVLATGFMVSMRTERLTSRSYFNLTKARAAADSGVESALARLLESMQGQKYFAVGYTNINSVYTNIPMIWGAASFGSAPVPRYLVSFPVATVTGPLVTDTTNSIALNFKKDANDKSGWMGSPMVITAGVTNQQYQDYRVPWIKILRDPTKAEQPNSKAPNYNPVVARYAYWIDDESSKLDYTMAGNTNGTSGSFKRLAGEMLATNMTKLVSTNMDLGALPLKTDNSSLGTDPLSSTINSQMISFRNGLPTFIPDLRILNRASALAGAAVWERIKFYATRFSLSQDLNSQGRRRVNLNHLVTNDLNARKISADLDDIVFVITGKHPFLSMGLTKTADQGVLVEEAEFVGPMPTFGQRFYPALVPGGDAAREKIYMLKLAANIRDYIDTDSQPTFVDSNGVVISKIKPTVAWLSGSEPWAIGKEAIPYYQEHCWRAMEISWSTVSGNIRNYKVEIDHYLEFYNPSTKNYTAPPGTFLKIYSGPTFRAGSYPWLELPDVELDISGEVFPAGRATVITTVPVGSDPPGLVLNPTYVIRKAIPASLRIFSGSTDEDVNGTRGLQLFGRTSTAADYRTEMLFGNNDGYIQAHPFIEVSVSTFPWNFKGQNVNDPRRFVFSSSLRGNDAVSRSGDPRSLNEQLLITAGSASMGNNQSRFFGNISGDSSIPGNATIAKASMSFVNPASAVAPWPDYNPALADNPATAPSVIRDEAMQSIGELGNIYDPHRKPPPAAEAGATGTIEYSRGGARSLRIGQPDDVIGPVNRFSSTWWNSAWQLTDYFSADETTKAVSDPTSRGRLNINGVLRDNGTAFKAALRSFRFKSSPESDPAIADGLLTDAEIDALVSDIKDFLKTKGPFMSRGEISEVPFFSTASTKTLAALQVKVTNDQAREEIFRRTVELITTKSLSFTIYAAGEAVRQADDGTITRLALQRKRCTVELEPQIGSGNFDVITEYKVKRVYETE